MFEGSRDLAARYEQLVEGMPRANRFATGEIITRTWQLDLILDMVRRRTADLKAAVAALDSGGTDLKEGGAQAYLIHEEIDLLAEAFYYFAHRIVTIIKKERLPHLGKLPRQEVSLIRNQLLEHHKPDPAAPFGRVSTLGGPSGPTFAKQGRDTRGVVSTGGLFENAERFAAALWTLFTGAIGEIQPPPAS